MIWTLTRLLVLLLGLAALAGPAAAAVSEPDRLWTVGVQAFDDGLYDVTYRELGRFLQVAKPDDPRRGDAAVLRGKAAFALRRYAEALTEFRAAETLPLRTFAAGEPIFWEAEVLFRLRRFDQARERYTQFLRVNPASPYTADALYARGFSELELGLPEEAVATLGVLMRDHPQGELAGSAGYALARELVRAKRWDEALAILGPYASRYPQSPFLVETQYLLGVAQLETGRVAEGVRTLEQFVARQPGHELSPTARVLLAEAHVKAGRAPQAIDQYRALIRNAPAHALVPQALYQIGDLSAGLGLARDAEAAWKTLRRDHPTDPLAELAGLELAGLYAKRQQLDRAAETAREVADAKGAQRPEALLMLGESLRKAGKTADARTVYATVMAEVASDAPARFRALAGVGLVAESDKDPEGAKRAYGEISGKASDEDLIKWARARVQSLEERERQEQERIRQEQERQEQERLRQEAERARQETERLRQEADRIRLEAERQEREQVERERREQVERERREREEREKAARSAKPKPKPKAKPKPKPQGNTS
jgi:TolA-binding protein